GQFHQLVRRDDQVFRESAVALAADHLELVADVVLPGPAVLALAADETRLRCGALPDLPAAHPRPKHLDLPGKLVAGRNRALDIGVFAVPRVYVRAAH